MASIEADIARAKKDVAAGKKKKAVITGEYGLRILVRGKRGESVTCFFRGERDGKVYEVQFGALSLIGLTKAQALAKQCRTWLRDGGGEHMKAKWEGARLENEVAQQGEKTFREFAAEWFKGFEKKFTKPGKTPYYVRDTRRILEKDILPHIGDIPIQKITRQMIFAKTQLFDLWHNKVTRGQRVHATMSKIFYFARKDCGEFFNPMEYDEALADILPREAQQSDNHYTPLPAEELPRFLGKLRGFGYGKAFCKKMGFPEQERRPVVSLMIEFALLNGCRIGEARLARWKEISWQTRTWKVPKLHLKNGDLYAGWGLARPLTQQMLAILEDMKRRAERRGWYAPDARIFRPTGSPGKLGREQFDDTAHITFKNNTLKWDGSPFDMHGFRTLLEDWRRKNETSFAEVWIEIQTDHPLKGRRRRAYYADELLNERKTMMEAWCQHCAQLAPPEREKPPRPCQHCGKPIPPDKPSHAKWCSVACRSAAGRAARYDKVLASNRASYARHREQRLAEKREAYRRKKAA
jgi:integrase